MARTKAKPEGSSSDDSAAECSKTLKRPAAAVPPPEPTVVDARYCYACRTGPFSKPLRSWNKRPCCEECTLAIGSCIRSGGGAESVVNKSLQRLAKAGDPRFGTIVQSLKRGPDGKRDRIALREAVVKLEDMFHPLA